MKALKIIRVLTKVVPRVIRVLDAVDDQVLEALDPASDGGSKITAQEAAQIGLAIAAAIVDEAA